MASNTERKIVLHRGADSRGAFVWSPFVTKLEFRFRYSKIAYEAGSGIPKSGPTGKIPYIEVNSTGVPTETLGDTAFITKRFIGKGLMPDLNADISRRDAGQDLAIKALLEDKLTFCNMHERWIENFYAMRDHNLSAIPYPLRVVVGYMIYRNAVSTLYGQGFGRLSADEIHLFRQEIWQAISDMLQDSKAKTGTGQSCFWIMGGQNPTEADFTVFGFVVSTLMATAAPKSRALVTKEFPTVVDYATRIQQQYFPDYETWKED